MQDSIIMTELTTSEALDIEGGGDCAEFAHDVGVVIGTAFQLFKAFGSGASEFDWATMK